MRNRFRLRLGTAHGQTTWSTVRHCWMLFRPERNAGGCLSDIVHITTPPRSHYSLAKQCLESGSHVYLEKPFTVTASETESLIQLAQRRGLKITAGHNYL